KGSARRAARLLRGVLGCSPSVRRQWPNTPPKARRASLVTLAACVCSRLPFPKAGQALRLADIPLALPAKCNVLHTYHNILTLLRAGRQFAGVQAFGCIFADSPLERNGFELPVPRENGYRSESSGFVYLPETVRVSSKDLPTSGTEVSNPTNFRFPDQNQHIV